MHIVNLLNKCLNLNSLTQIKSSQIKIQNQKRQSNKRMRNSMKNQSQTRVNFLIMSHINRKNRPEMLDNLIQILKNLNKTLNKEVEKRLRKGNKEIIGIMMINHLTIKMIGTKDIKDQEGVAIRVEIIMIHSLNNKHIERLNFVLKCRG